MPRNCYWIVSKRTLKSGTVYCRSTCFKIPRWTTDKSKAKRFSSLMDLFRSFAIHRSRELINIERIDVNE